MSPDAMSQLQSENPVPGAMEPLAIEVILRRIEQESSSRPGVRSPRRKPRRALSALPVVAALGVTIAVAVLALGLLKPAHHPSPSSQSAGASQGQTAIVTRRDLERAFPVLRRSQTAADHIPSAGRLAPGQQLVVGQERLVWRQGEKKMWLVPAGTQNVCLLADHGLGSNCTSRAVAVREGVMSSVQDRRGVTARLKATYPDHSVQVLATQPDGAFVLNLARPARNVTITTPAGRVLQLFGKCLPCARPGGIPAQLVISFPALHRARTSQDGLPPAIKQLIITSENNSRLQLDQSRLVYASAIGKVWIIPGAQQVCLEQAEYVNTILRLQSGDCVTPAYADAHGIINQTTSTQHGHRIGPIRVSAVLSQHLTGITIALKDGTNQRHEADRDGGLLIDIDRPVRHITAIAGNRGVR
jgi:hypothetical protein